MEIRKVQVTGGSSFVITLPKEWAEKQKVKKNDPLGLVIQPDGTLLVTKEIAERPLQREKRFDATNLDDQRFLFRLLIAAYITGYTSIVVSAKNRLSSPARVAVRDFSQMTIGPEVVEETETSIVLKDLLNPAEMPLENTLRRMYVVVRNMHADAMNVLGSGNGGLSADVVARDNDVDRLHWLVARQTYMSLRDPGIARRMEGDPSRVVKIYVISRIIERIGDHAVRLAENAQKVPAGAVSDELLGAFRKADNLALSLFDRSIHSFFTADIRGSHENIEKTRELVAVCREIEDRLISLPQDIAVALSDIAESIRRSGEYSGDISENVINLLVEEAG